METTLIFREGINLPHFASFVLLDDPDGLEALRSYYAAYGDSGRARGRPRPRHADMACECGLGRSARVFARAAYDVNRRAVELLEGVRADAEDGDAILISGCIGPRGDGYVADALMSAEEAQSYHEPQVRTFANSAADLVSFLTVTYRDEAVGVVRAAEEAAIPAVVSFTVETDGRLPDGTALRGAVEAVDEATDASAAYYMINCAHPDHFEDVLDGGSLAGTGSRASRKCLSQEQRRARRVRGSGRRRSSRACGRLHAPALALPEPQRRGRMLRRRRAPRRGDLRRVEPPRLAV
jgi:S-methylmethionine-dependent homocysteine/selenocysteine methylase